MGCKVSDEFTVPLCRTHHRDNHRFGDEAAWWGRQAIDPIGLRGSSGFQCVVSNEGEGFASMARSEAKDGSDVDQFFEGALTSISLQNWR